MNAICPSEEQLVRLFEDALEQAEALALEQHAESCAQCQGVLETLQALDAAITEPDAASPEFMQRMLALPDTAPARPRAGRLVALALASAAALLLALVLRDSFGVRDENTRPIVNSASARPTLTRTATPTAEAAAEESSLSELSMPALHRLARGDDSERARLALVRLGQIGRRESLPVLVDVVRRADRRFEAVRALGALRDVRAVRTLEPLLRDPEVVDAAREALVRVGGSAAALALSRAVAASDDESQTALLIDALAQADGTAGIRELGLLLASEEAARAGAARQAVRRHEARLLPQALEELAGPSAARVGAALQVLEVLVPSAAVPALEGLLQHRAHRAHAAEVLMRIDTPEAAQALWRVRHLAEARRAFRRAGPATERFLLGRLEQGSRQDRRSAIDLLGLCGGPAAVPQLADLADDPALAPGVLLSLGRIGGEEAVDVLAALAGRPALQRRAVAALGMTGCPAAVAELERLGAGTRTLRVDAQRALATIPCAEAIEAIVRLDLGGRASRTAERALRGMDRDLVLATLDTLLERDPPVENRLAATVRRVRHAVGGPASADAPRIALN